MITRIHNPNCDGDHCTSAVGEVRLISTGEQSNVILCRRCHFNELMWRAHRNLTLPESGQFDRPTWDSLSVYE